MKSKTGAELLAICKAAQAEMGRRETLLRESKNASKVGRYFKTRNNYSCPEKRSDYWWTYEFCTRMDQDGMLKTYRFETDKYGNVRVNFDHHAYHLQYAKPCSKGEFYRAFKKMQRKVSRLP